jgi:L-fuconolactonase
MFASKPPSPLSVYIYDDILYLIWRSTTVSVRKGGQGQKAMIIDAHQHFWRLSADHRQWPTADLSAIYRDAMPADLLTVARASGVSGAVAVQAQPDERETQWLLALADAEPFIRGVVGWTDLEASDAVDHIGSLARTHGLVGLRPMLQGLSDDAWIARASVAPALDAMARSGLALDALVYARHLPALLDVCRRGSGLRVVIDHAAKPPIASGDLSEWRDALIPFAALDHVSCKVSGLLTEGRPGQDEADYRAVIDHLLQVFGPDRLIWGSDWPVLDLAGDYAGWFDMANRWLGLTGAEAEAVFGGNALTFYGLDAARAYA